MTGSECAYDPFATKGQATACGKVLDAFSKKGVAYTKVDGAPGAAPSVTIGGKAVATTPDAIDAGLKAAGYDLDKQTPPFRSALLLALAVIAIGFLAGITYGPVAALLVEMFPARVRYTSMSIPYHIGAGYFGGFLPFINQYIVAKTGDPFAGLWYTLAVVALGLVVMVVGVPETVNRRLD